MFEQTFKNIDDILHKDAGCGSELDYVEQTSWVLFLKYLDDLEKDKQTAAELSGKSYSKIIDDEFQWTHWAAPKLENGKIDHNALTGDDLADFVNIKLLPYLKNFKVNADNANTIEYKIGEIFSELKNRIQSGYNLREVVNLIDELHFRTHAQKHEMSHLYESKIKNMGNAGCNGGEYYTPRPLIKTIVKVVSPKIGNTIYDFVDAYQRFSDPEWDGEPVEEDPCKVCGENPCVCTKKVKIKLKDGKEREIQHMVATSFWSADGKPISAEEFLNNLFGELPNLFKDENELRTLWSNPQTRKTLLKKLDEAGFSKDELDTLKKLIDAQKSDLFDVLEYVFNSDRKPITREERVRRAKATILAFLNKRQQEFIKFVLTKYIESGVEELDQEKLPVLLTNKYHSLEDAKEILGEVAEISSLFIEFQQHLYSQKVA